MTTLSDFPGFSAVCREAAAPATPYHSGPFALDTALPEWPPDAYVQFVAGLGTPPANADGQSPDNFLGLPHSADPDHADPGAAAMPDDPAINDGATALNHTVSPDGDACDAAILRDVTALGEELAAAVRRETEVNDELEHTRQAKNRLDARLRQQFLSLAERERTRSHGLSEELVNARHEIERLHGLLAVEQERNCELAGSLANAQENLEKAGADNDRLYDRIDALVRDMNEQRSQHRAELVELQVRHEELHSGAHDLAAEVARYRDAVDQLQKTNATAQEELEQARAQRNVACSERESLQRKRQQEIAEYEERLEEQRVQHERLRTDLDRARQQITAARNHLDAPPAASGGRPADEVEFAPDLHGVFSRLRQRGAAGAGAGRPEGAQT